MNIRIIAAVSLFVSLQTVAMDPSSMEYVSHVNKNKRYRSTILELLDSIYDNVLLLTSSKSLRLDVEAMLDDIGDQTEFVEENNVDTFMFEDLSRFIDRIRDMIQKTNKIERFALAIRCLRVLDSCVKTMKAEWREPMIQLRKSETSDLIFEMDSLEQDKENYSFQKIGRK